MNIDSYGDTIFEIIRIKTSRMQKFMFFSKWVQIMSLLFLLICVLHEGKSLILSII